MGRIVHHKQLHAFGCLTLYVLLIDSVLSDDFKIHHLCEPCDKVKSACPQLHVHCRTDRRPCGCCDVCVGKFGDPCSASSVRYTFLLHARIQEVLSERVQL